MRFAEKRFLESETTTPPIKGRKIFRDRLRPIDVIGYSSDAPVVDPTAKARSGGVE